MYRKKQLERTIAFVCSLSLFALGLGAKRLKQTFNLAILGKWNLYMWCISGVILTLLVIEFLFANHIRKGIRYFWQYWRITNKLERQMIDANFGIRRAYYIEVPKIKLTFSKDLSLGELRIRNTLKHDKKLDDVVMSSALGKFVVERHYQTDDGNYYIYELIDGSVSFKQNFNTYDDFIRYSKKIPAYKLFLDKRSIVKLQHCLLVGMTGSGKTYALYSLLLQMLSKDVPYYIYCADPKGSSLAVIGYGIVPERTATDIEGIIRLLEEFVELMRKRKAELKEKLKTRIDSDYSDFGMSPYVFVCDEYTSFAAVLASLDKSTRDKVKALIYEVILQGRQLGFFLFLVMQKSDATFIDTALRENMPLKIVLGNSGQQTYVTAFGTGVDIPNRHYQMGEGVFIEPAIAPEPKFVQCPMLDFDIMNAMSQTRVV